MLLCENNVLVVQGIWMRHIDHKVQLFLLQHCPQLVSGPLLKKNLAGGELLIKAGQDFRKQDHASVRADPKADQMAALVLDIPDPCIQLLPGVQRVQRPVVKELSGVGQCHGPSASLEEFDSQFLLEILNAQRQRRLRDKEFSGGLSDAFFLGGGDNILQLVPVHRGSLS